jgi:anti-sigma regulatory factor (Ser/Thr protein kinase)
MDVNGSASFRMNDRSIVAEVRRAAAARARAMGWGETACGESEIVATELATNLVKHARGGVVALSSAPDAAPGGSLLVVAVDCGPGIADVARSFRDGFSTSGSPGTGLGAVKRLAYETDVISAPDGTVMVAELRTRAPAPETGPRSRIRVAGFGVPKEGELVNGDAWRSRWRGHRLAIIVCDGLGHGHEAAKAAARAIECFDADGWETPKQIMELANEALRPTRGAAAAVAIIDPKERRVRFCGVGNIVAGIVAGEQTRHMVSHNGILGSARRIAEFDYEWPPGATMIMHSDGLSGRWQTARWGGVWRRHPALIAGTAYRDLARGTDDAVVVVASDHAAAS